MQRNVLAPTRLITKDIDGMHDAGYMIGEERFTGGYRLEPLVLRPSRGVCSWWMVVPKGFSALVTAHGRFLGIWGAGFHPAAPWVTCTHLIPQQYIVYDTPVKECPTADNVMVEIDVTLVFHILQTEDDLKNFAYKLGPEKLDKMLKAFQEEAVRDMARKRRYNQVYDLMDSHGDQQLANTVRVMNDNLNEYGVEVERITITNVKLHPELAQTMQSATTWDAQNRYNTIKQEFDLLKIDNAEREAQRRQQVDEERRQAQQEMDKAQAVAKADLKRVEAGTEKIVAEVKEGQQADVLKIETDGELKVAQISAENQVQLSKIRSEGDATASQVRVEADAKTIQLRAEADKVVAANNAQALALKAEAEQRAAAQLVAKRRYEESLHQLRVLKALAENGNVVISGNNGDNAVAQLVAARESSSILSINAQ